MCRFEGVSLSHLSLPAYFKEKRFFSMAVRTLAKIFGVVAVIVGCVSLPLSSPAADSPRRIEIVAKRFNYTPSEIELKKGEPVVLVIHSADVAHGLKCNELHLQTDIGKGATSEVSFTPTQAGDFLGHCSHFCGAHHGSMILTLHVTG
jgi:cytochrome c oxidase subunit 2